MDVKYRIYFNYDSGRQRAPRAAWCFKEKRRRGAVCRSVRRGNDENYVKNKNEDANEENGKVARIRDVLPKISAGYSHSKAPFFHSYMKPIVKIKRKTNVDQKPNIVSWFSVTAQGNKKLTSKSKIINKIATR